MKEVMAKEEWKLSKGCYGDFVNEALKGGAKVGHMVTKLRAPPLGVGVRLSVMDEISAEEAKWGSLWCHGEVPPDFTAETVSMGPRITVDDIRGAAGCFGRPPPARMGYLLRRSACLAMCFLWLWLVLCGLLRERGAHRMGSGICWWH